MGEAEGRTNGTSGASGAVVAGVVVGRGSAVVAGVVVGRGSAVVAEVVVGRAVVVAEAGQGLDVALHKISTALDRTPLPDVARFRKQAVAK